MFSKLRNATGKAFLATSAMIATMGAAHAQATDPFTQMFAAINLTTVAAAVVVAGLAIVGISLAFKSPDVAKRVVKKV